MAVGAVLLAGLATGALGIGFGRPLAERGGLALTLAVNAVQFRPEAHDLRLQRLQLAALLLDECQQFVVGRSCFGHRRQTMQLTGFWPVNPLIKYNPTLREFKTEFGNRPCTACGSWKLLSSSLRSVMSDETGRARRPRWVVLSTVAAN